MKPTIGRLVHYRTTQADRDNSGSPAKVLPAVISNVHGEEENSPVNLKVMQDSPSPDEFKATVMRGDLEGQWNWPPIVR